MKGAEEGFKEGNTLEATAKAAIAAWRASQVGFASCTPRPCPLLQCGDLLESMLH